ncbi:MAG TPA: hypothetical protein ENK18_17490 [Deltaproteobacteria bacterium]|nr:hypothetical protein [Deltaproteobacteria bacterium]
MTLRNTVLMMGCASLGIGLAGCGTEPTRSQCEAVCDWAVSCHVADRDVDQATLLDECLAATRAVDDSCGKAENGELNIASLNLLTPCITAVDSNADAGECGAFTGSLDEIKTSIPPAQCAGTGNDAVAVFEAAKDATNESGEELCQRMTNTLCDRATECILGDFNDEIPQEVIDLVGGTPEELCVQRLDPVFTTSCIDNGLYEAETSITDANLNRQSARECLDTLGETECADLFAGNLNPLCAGTFSNPEDALAVAQALLSLSDEFAAAASSIP